MKMKDATAKIRNKTGIDLGAEFDCRLAGNNIIIYKDGYRIALKIHLRDYDIEKLPKIKKE